MNNWLPIKTAPKTRRAVLVYCPENQCQFMVSWDSTFDRWNYFGGMGELTHTPSHWMPLPPSPSA